MIGKEKKTVSLAYRDKLLAEIAHYEKRISDALHKNNSNSLNTIEEVESSDDDCNPYTLNIAPSAFELKRQEADLSNRASMTLELAMLTIMQSEVNVMVTAPDVSKPITEDGTWLEVAAECKIDLVSFTITFYAHKPHRRFAPLRYRNVEVNLTKAAHQKELAQSVLTKLNRPNLALQVLQSYATAFRSRRTTLLELAEKYAEKLRMEAMPDGGYRVRFLDLLTVDWSLENLWSPIVPFCHRMKFEVEYMPKEYIHAIGRHYKRFKDPSLETAERTRVLAEIFDTCLLALGPARDLRESAESDPETAGRLHERRTTIDQEPDMPPNYVHESPKKLPKGKENKAQNRKTAMEPPKAIPKKAKKGAKKRPNSELSNSSSNVSKRTNDEKEDTRDIHMDIAKKTKPIGSSINKVVENRKGVKRAIESDGQSNAKKARSDNDVSSNSKSSGDTANTKRKANDDVISDTNISNATSKSNAPKKVNKVANPKNLKKGNDDSDKGGDLNNATVLKKKVSDDNRKNIAKIGAKVVDTAKEKSSKASVDNPKNDNNQPNKETAINSKNVEENVTKKTVSKKVKTDAKNAADSVSSKTSTQKSDGAKSSNVANDKITGNEGITKKTTKKPEGDKPRNTDTVSKKSKDKDSDVVQHVLTQNVQKNTNKVANGNKTSNVVDKTDTNEVVAKNGTKKVDGSKPASSKTTKVKNSNDLNDKKNKIEEDSNKVENKTVKETNNKATKLKESANVTAKKKASTNNLDRASNVNKEYVETTDKIKATNATFTKSSDDTSVSKKTEKSDKIDKPTNTKDNTVSTNKKKDTLVQKNITKTISDNNKIKKVAIIPVEKAKNMPKLIAKGSNSKTNNMVTNANKNETVKVTEKNKANSKVTANIPSNIQSKPTINKPQNANLKTLNKPTNLTEKRAVQKFAQNQAKITEKLKSKIPMMKSKMKLSTITNKLDKDATKAADAKTRIPQKSLPVFKKIVKNFPTRMSPRKLPSTFKPSSQGFSSK